MDISFESEIRDVVGAENIVRDPEILKKYSMDQSFTKSCMPDAVVFVKSVKEVQSVVRIANKHHIPIIPYSSGMNLRGATIPNYGGIILNLTKMNKILMVNKEEGWVLIEPGVTYTQLQDELSKYGLRVMVPFGTPPSRSVVSSIIEDEPTLAAASFEYGNALYMDIEIVLPTGEILRFGKWKSLVDGRWGEPGGGGLQGEKDIHETIWIGAQGTFGIITKLVVKVEPIPKLSRIYFLTLDSDLDEETIRLVKEIQKREIGIECFALNNFNLAALLNKEWDLPENFPCESLPSKNFEELKEKLPVWTFILHICGFSYFPEEKIAYEEEALYDVCKNFNVTPRRSISGVEEDLESFMIKEILRPWGILKKAHYKGSFHPVSFYVKPSMLLKVKKELDMVLTEKDYPLKDLGAFILPVERGRCFYCEFDLHCNLNNKEEREKVKNAWLKAYEAVIDMGAVPAHSYGLVAGIVSKRIDQVYLKKIKQIKQELDPNNIMNPGKLYF